VSETAGRFFFCGWTGSSPATSGVLSPWLSDQRVRSWAPGWYL